MRIKRNDDGKWVNAETNQPVQIGGEDIEVEGIRTQDDVQAAINAKTKKYREEMDALKQALDQAKADSTTSREQIKQLEEMFSAKQKEADDAERQAKEKAQAEIQSLRLKFENEQKARVSSESIYHRELTRNSILALANREGKQFFNPMQVVELMQRSAKIEDRKDEKGQVVLDDMGFPIKEISFRTEMDEIDPTTKKPTGRKVVEYLPTEKAVDHLLSESPNLMKGTNTGGSGGMGGGGRPGSDGGLYTREQLKTMSPQEVNANWDKVSASLTKIGT